MTHLYCTAIEIIRKGGRGDYRSLALLFGVNARGSKIRGASVVAERWRVTLDSTISIATRLM